MERRVGCPKRVRRFFIPTAYCSLLPAFCLLRLHKELVECPAQHEYRHSSLRVERAFNQWTQVVVAGIAAAGESRNDLSILADDEMRGI